MTVAVCIYQISLLLIFNYLSFLEKYLLFINKYLPTFAFTFQNVNKMSTKTKTETILVIMNVLAWIVFIGLMIEAGAVLVSYGVSIVNPKAAKNLYKGLDFYNLSQYDFWHYTGIISLKAAILIIEAYTAFLVIKVLSTIKITNPFTMDVAQRLEKIAYMLMLAWGAIIIYNGQLKWLSKEVAGLLENKLSSELIIYAGLVFVIAQIFKKGVEIQDENELTV